MLVCIKCLAIAFILDVPDTYCLVIRGTDDVLATLVEHKTSHPVIMTNLNNRHKNKPINVWGLGGR